MTNQTRSFIDLSDLIAWRFECRNCHASLELSLDKLEKGTLNECPHCHRHWALVPTDGYSSSSFEPLFTKFLGALDELKRVLGEKSVLGFSLTIEINQPVPPPQK
jgi:hypothetical protein